jgi:hypothetical protein
VQWVINFVVFLEQMRSCGKGKVQPRTGHEGSKGESRCNSVSLTSALGGGGWLTPRHNAACVPQGPSTHLTAGGVGRSERVRKILSPPRVDSRTVQPVASRYTD